MEIVLGLLFIGAAILALTYSNRGKNYQQQIATLHRSIDDRDNDIRKKRLRIQSLENSNATLETNQAKLERDHLESIETQAADYEKDIDAANAKTQEAVTRCKELKAQVSKLEKELVQSRKNDTPRGEDGKFKKVSGKVSKAAPKKRAAKKAAKKK